MSTGLVKPLSLNDRMGWQQKARLTRETRAAVGWHTLALKVGAHDHLHIRLVYTPATTRRRDTDNLWATAKPAVDGLVDAGAVPDDTPDYVTRHEPKIAQPDPTLTGCRVWLQVWTADGDT